MSNSMSLYVQSSRAVFLYCLYPRLLSFAQCVCASTHAHLSPHTSNEPPTRTHTNTNTNAGARVADVGNQFGHESASCLTWSWVAFVVAGCPIYYQSAGVGRVSGRTRGAHEGNRRDSRNIWGYGASNWLKDRSDEIHVLYVMTCNFNL